jgi:hypothetical protein
VAVGKPQQQQQQQQGEGGAAAASGSSSGLLPRLATLGSEVRCAGCVYDACDV